MEFETLDLSLTRASEGCYAVKADLILISIYFENLKVNMILISNDQFQR